MQIALKSLFSLSWKDFTYQSLNSFHEARGYSMFERTMSWLTQFGHSLHHLDNTVAHTGQSPTIRNPRCCQKRLLMIAENENGRVNDSWAKVGEHSSKSSTIEARPPNCALKWGVVSAQWDTSLTRRRPVATDAQICLAINGKCYIKNIDI